MGLAAAGRSKEGRGGQKGGRHTMP
jgi:hypothetical protein